MRQPSRWLQHITSLYAREHIRELRDVHSIPTTSGAEHQNKRAEHSHSNQPRKNGRTRLFDNSIKNPHTTIEFQQLKVAAVQTPVAHSQLPLSSFDLFMRCLEEEYSESATKAGPPAAVPLASNAVHVKNTTGFPSMASGFDHALHLTSHRRAQVTCVNDLASHFTPPSKAR